MQPWELQNRIDQSVNQASVLFCFSFAYVSSSLHGCLGVCIMFSFVSISQVIG